MPRPWKSLLAAGLLAGSPLVAAAQDVSDLASRQAGLQAVAAQRFEVEVTAALAEARALAATSPEKAAARLKQVLHQLDADTLLPAEARRSLTARVRAGLAAPGRRPDARPDARSADQPAKPTSDPDVTRYEAELAEARQVAAGLGEVERLYKAGKLVDAEIRAGELADKFPLIPAARAMVGRQSLVTRLREANNLINEMNKRIDAAMRDVTRSAIPAKGDMELPKDWAEKSKRRNKDVLTEKERAIMRSLDAEITLNVKEVSFQSFLDGLAERIGQPIILDKSALADLTLDATAPVTAALKGVSTRTALKKVLGDLGLTYVIKNETIVVTSQVRARDMMVSRVYYIGDLTQMTGPFGGAVTWGPWIDFQQTQENARGIVQTIEASIDPGSWKSGGGNGSIVYHAPTNSLIIRQTAEVHAVLQSKLGR